MATRPIRPLGPAEPVGDLLTVHEAAAIELRLVQSLWPFVDLATASTVGFSGIRLGQCTRQRRLTASEVAAPGADERPLRGTPHTVTTGSTGPPASGATRRDGA